MPGKAVEEHGELPTLHAVPVGWRYDIPKGIPIVSIGDRLRHIVLVPLFHKGRGNGIKKIPGLILCTVYRHQDIRADVGIIEPVIVPACDIIAAGTKRTERGRIIKVQRQIPLVHGQDPHRIPTRGKRGIIHHGDSLILGRKPEIMIILRHTERPCCDLHRPCCLVDGKTAAGEI